MKPLLITTLLAFAAPQADAGDWSFGFDFGYRKRSKSVRVGVGVRRDEHRPRVVERCERIWVDGHYDTVTRRVWVPAQERHVVHPAVYRTTRRHGRTVRVLVRAAYTECVRVPAHYETRQDRVWHPGHWEYDCHVAGHRHDHVVVRDRGIRRR